MKYRSFGHILSRPQRKPREAFNNQILFNHNRQQLEAAVHMSSISFVILVAARYTYCDEEAVWDFKLSMAPKVAAAIS